MNRDNAMSEPGVALAGTVTRWHTSGVPTTSNAFGQKITAVMAAKGITNQSEVARKMALREVADRLRCHVRELDLGDHARGASHQGSRVIVVSPSGIATRDAFTLGHELIEIHLPEWVPGEAAESFCDRGAAALLLPRRTFLATLAREGLHLPQLRRRHPWVSYTTIGRRVVDLVPSSAFSMWEGEEVELAAYREACHAGGEPSIEVATAHALAVSAALGGRGVAELHHAGVRAAAWRLTGARRAIAVSVAA